MKKFALALLFAAAAVGCKSGAQVPPTSHTVTITITPPSGATGLSYVVSRAVGAATCPTPNVTTPNYTPLNQSNPMSGTTFVDSGVAGQTVCYIAQSVVGGAVSQPSNTAGPFAVPANPTAPSIGGQTAEVVLPSDFKLPAYIDPAHVTAVYTFSSPSSWTNSAGPQIAAVVR